MHKLNKWIGDFSWSGDPIAGAYALLKLHGHMDAIRHSKQVADIGEILADVYGVDSKEMTIAAAMHSIGDIIPDEDKLEAAGLLGIPLLKEEIEFPALAAQKLSVVMANSIFSITSPKVLNAIGCHSTLKANPSAFDMVFFICDKMVSITGEDKDLADNVQNAILHSLDKACLVYIQSMLNSDRLLSPHPWLMAAYQSLYKRVKASNDK